MQEKTRNEWNENENAESHSGRMDGWNGMQKGDWLVLEFWVLGGYLQVR
jgi:hypothetical protein